MRNLFNDASGAVNELNDTVNELSSTLNDKADISLLTSGDDHFQFGVDDNGNYGYVKKIGGADTVIPFKTVGTRSTEITVNGTYIAKTDISKDGYESVTVVVPQPTPNLQSKTVAAGTADVTVTPDASYDGLSSVVVQPTPSQTKSVTPSTSAQTVTPDSGKYLSSVSVGAISTQTKSATPSTSAQTVSPDSGKFLSSVSVAAIPNLHTTNSMIVPRWGTGPGSSVPATRIATLNPRIDFNNSRQYGNVEMVEIAMPEGYYAWSYGNSSCCIPTETKTVTAGTSATTVTPTEYNTADKFVKFLKSVTVNPTPSQAKSTVASMSNVTVSPDSGKYLSSVTVTPNVIKLWTNSSPTASFTTKDITISGGITAYKYIFFRIINITSRTDLESIAGFNTSNLFYWTISAENVSGNITTTCIAPMVAHGSVTNWRPLCYINSTTLRFEKNLTALGKSNGSVVNYYNTSNQNRIIPLECYGIKA